MKERPILFSGAMVRAILAGTKTQTRRIVRCDDAYNGATWKEHDGRWHPCRDELCRSILDPIGTGIACPYGVPGDRLWVRETFCVAHRNCWDAPKTVNPGCPDEAAYYAAGWERSAPGAGWKPSIHMPRWASRITLEVTSVRVERLQDISEEDARAEGVRTGAIPADDYGPERIGFVLGDDDGRCTLYPDARRAFEVGWDGINAARAPWSSNPWVWVVSFRLVSRHALASKDPTP